MPATSPPADMEYGTVPGGFSCANCEYYKATSAPDRLGECTFQRASRPPPFKVLARGCCRFFDNAQYDGDKPAPSALLARAAAAPRTTPPRDDPLGRDAATASTRKPTERHLDRIIDQYRREYTTHSRNAVDAAVRLARETGPSLTLHEARGAFLRELNPILEEMKPHVDLAVRLGASRFPETPTRVVDQSAAVIVPRVRDERAGWLTKMAGDFVHRVLAPALGLGAGANLLWDVAHEDDGAGGPPPGRGPVPTGSDGGVSPNDFVTTSPDGTFTFTQTALDDLQERGYTFAKLRAVEATESDVWSGDDLGYISAAQHAGVTTLEWRTSPDDLVCPICSELDGETYTVPEAAMVSADRATATHCRCRCWFSSTDDPQLPVDAGFAEA